MTIRVAVTGAGGPSAVSFLQAVSAPRVDLFAGDIDPYAPGLYLVHPDQRWILYRGGDPRFVDDLLTRCIAARITVLVPTVDQELLPLARRRDEFARHGIRLLLANIDTLETCLDKAALIRRCEGACSTPRTAILEDDLDLSDWPMPLLVKPRSASRGHGVRRIDDLATLDRVLHDGSYIVQEFLAGAEYSVDVLCSPAGEVLAAVPRARLKLDSGIAVTGVTLHDARLEASARCVAKTVGVTFVANIRFRDDSAGVPKLLEVNPRFPGTMPLTVAAGVNMPRLALDMLLGYTLPEDVGAFRDVGMVRVWREHFVDISEIDALLHMRAKRELPAENDSGSR